jgi:hypothetical protein
VSNTLEIVKARMSALVALDIAEKSRDVDSLDVLSERLCDALNRPGQRVAAVTFVALAGTLVSAAQAIAPTHADAVDWINALCFLAQRRLAQDGVVEQAMHAAAQATSAKAGPS